jgi:A/G-specific adenine glycosylase
MEWANELINWYLIEKRNLPWRNTKDPYLIWLSEIILQQTRVAQGLPYYYKFTEAYPTVFDLAMAKEDAVLKTWQGLGYYSRARNMLKTAKSIVADYNGNFPNNYNDLLKLKGIGQYTAAAIASFAFDEKVAVLDGNVYRVLARYFGIEAVINLGTSKKLFLEIANTLIPESNPGMFNQAIMEFGALQCIPKNPNCAQCPFCVSCFAFKNNKVDKLPVKEAKRLSKIRYFNYVHFHNPEIVYLVKRGHTDIWANLYELPLIETNQAANDFEIKKAIEDILSTSLSDYELSVDLTLTHKLTHQTIYARFWRLESSFNLPAIFLKIPRDELQSYPISRLTEKYFERMNLQ